MTISRVLCALAALAVAAPIASALPASYPAVGVPTPPPDTAVTTKFDVDGVTVILRQNPANEVIAANLYFLGGARQLTPAERGDRGADPPGERARHETLPGRPRPAGNGDARQHDLDRSER